MKKASVFAAVCLLLVLAANCACASGISIPNNTTVIGKRAFYGDQSITKVELPEGVTQIEEEAFAHTSLESILLPMSLKDFAEDAFEDCPDALEIWVYKNSKAWKLCHEYGLDDKIREMPPPTTANKVGISLPTKDLQRWATDGALMKSALTELGYDVDLQYASNDIAAQVTQIEDMIDNGCHMLVIASIEGDSLGTILDQAKEQNIPVLAYNHLIMNSDAVTYYVTFGSYMIGKMQGEYIRDQLELDTTAGPYKIELTAGDLRDENARMFFEGAMGVLSPYIEDDKLNVKSGQTGFEEVATSNWSSENAQKRAASILADYYPDGTGPDAWMCSNDSVALGIIHALEKRNDTGSWPVITGQDCDLQNVRCIMNNKQSMSVFRDTRILAKKAAVMVNAALLGQDVPVNDTETYNNNVMIIPTFLCEPIAVDKDNYYEILIGGGFYQEDDLR